jgi:predicted  nucleic acid-binding Zn ribbon protein
MHQISIRYTKKVDEEMLFGLFDGLHSALRENGQVNGRERRIYAHKGKMHTIFFTVTKSALSSKYHSQDVIDFIEKIEKLCKEPLETKYNGRYEDEKDSICKCKKEKRKYLVLYYFNDSSPVICSSCDKAIPIYTLPKIHHSVNYWELVGWLNNYNACVILDVNCSVGERWAIKQQCDYKSELSKEGRAVAAKIAEVTGTPTYYFLPNFSKTPPKKDQTRPCPSCGGDWHLDAPIHGYFRHRCDKCLLMSAYNNKS